MEKIAIGDFEDFEELRKFCEALESEGFLLNVRDSVYERML